MLKKEALSKAISAHAGWKARLRNVVSTGVSDAPVSTVQADNKCEFGQWLYGPDVSATEKKSEHYLKVKQLHAEFHKQAAKVVDLATSNQKEKATRAIGLGGEYAKASTILTDAMIRWRDSAN